MAVQEVAVLSRPGLIMVAVTPQALGAIIPHHVMVVVAMNLLLGAIVSARLAEAASPTIVAEAVVAARGLLPDAHPRLLTIMPLPVVGMAGAAATIILQEAGADMMRSTGARTVAGGTTMNPTDAR